MRLLSGGWIVGIARISSKMVGWVAGVKGQPKRAGREASVDVERRWIMMRFHRHVHHFLKGITGRLIPFTPAFHRNTSSPCHLRISHMLYTHSRITSHLQLLYAGRDTPQCHCSIALFVATMTRHAASRPMEAKRRGWFHGHRGGFGSWSRAQC